MSALLTGADFDGQAYQRELDFARLTGQLKRVHDLMLQGRWLTLREIASATGDPEASVSAQLRHLRKRRFGSFVIEKRRRGEESRGLYEYRMVTAGPAMAASGVAR